MTRDAGRLGADTFAFATALERHLNWKYLIIARNETSLNRRSRCPQIDRFTEYAATVKRAAPLTA